MVHTDTIGVQTVQSSPSSQSKAKPAMVVSQASPTISPSRSPKPKKFRADDESSPSPSSSPSPVSITTTSPMVQSDSISPPRMPMRKSSLQSSSHNHNNVRREGRQHRISADQNDDNFDGGGTSRGNKHDDDDGDECRPRIGDIEDNNDDGDDDGILQVRRKRSKTNKNMMTMKRTKTPKKSVCFYQRVRVRRIPSIDQIPQSMFQDLFYSRGELVQLHLALREKLQHYTDHTDIVEDEEDKYDDGGVFCFRGLESELPDTKIRRRLLRAIARKTVIMEQKAQRKEGHHDPMTLSLLYQKESFPAIEAAVLMAAMDEFEARMIHNEE